MWYPFTGFNRPGPINNYSNRIEESIIFYTFASGKFRRPLKILASQVASFGALWSRYIRKWNTPQRNIGSTQCEEIEANKVNSKTVRQKIKEVTGRKVAAKTGCIRSKDGDILMEKENILNRWSEYITELYHDDIGHQLSSIMMKAPKFLRRKFKRPSKIWKKARWQAPKTYHPKC